MKNEDEMWKAMGGNIPTNREIAELHENKKKYSKPNLLKKQKREGKN